MIIIIIIIIIIICSSSSIISISSSSSSSSSMSVCWPFVLLISFMCVGRYISRLPGWYSSGQAVAPTFVHALSPWYCRDAVLYNRLLLGRHRILEGLCPDRGMLEASTQELLEEREEAYGILRDQGLGPGC